MSKAELLAAAAVLWLTAGVAWATSNASMTAVKTSDIWNPVTDNIVLDDEYADMAFRLYDINHDGVISIEEWHAAH